MIKCKLSPMLKIILLMVLLPFTLGSCNSCELQGSFFLGSNLYLMEGDKEEDRAVIKCGYIPRSNECCNGGMVVFPTKDDRMIKGRYNKHVEWVMFNERWIVIKYEYSNKQNESRFLYTLLDKAKLAEKDYSKSNFVDQVQDTAIGPISEIELNKYLKHYDIDINGLHKL